MSYVVACGGHCELSACGLSLPQGGGDKWRSIKTGVVLGQGGSYPRPVTGGGARPSRMLTWEVAIDKPEIEEREGGY